MAKSKGEVGGNGLSSLTLNEIQQACQDQWAAGLVPMIWGPPGVGKSASMHEVASRMTYTIHENPKVAAKSTRLAEVYGSTHTGRVVKDVRLVACQPTDVMGFPVFDTENARASWVQTDLFPENPDRLAEMEEELVLTYDLLDDTDDDGVVVRLRRRILNLERDIERALHDQYAIVFLDELPQAPNMVQAAAFGLVLDRKVGTYRLPDTACLVAAGNRTTDQAGAGKILTPLLSRLAHLTLTQPSVDEWIVWARSKGLENDIIAYLKFRPEDFFDFNPKKLTGSADTGDVTFPCPRTWEFASRALAASTDDSILATVLSGIVGAAAANQFYAWRALYRKLPDPIEYLDGKLKLVPEHFQDNNGKPDPSLEYAFVFNLLDIVIKKEFDPAKNERDQARGQKFIEFLTEEKRRVEWCAITMKQMQENNEWKLMKVKNFAKLAKAANIKNVILGR